MSNWGPQGLRAHWPWGLQLYKSKSTWMYHKDISFHLQLHFNALLTNNLKGILSTKIVIFSYPKLLSFSILTFIKWRLNTELLANTLRNVVFFRFKKADHRYWKLINYALTWARPNLFLSIFMPVARMLQHGC